MSKLNPDKYAESNSEHAHQVALFMWAADPVNRDLWPDLAWLFAVPNGGWRNKVVATRLKAEGVKAGVPDIWLPVKRGNWSGLIIELKAPPSSNKVRRPRASPQQEPWIEYLRTQSFGAMVCAGWHETRQAIVSYLDYGKEM